MDDMDCKSHVFVAMSGGVDSAVAAASLVDQGFQVTGIHMQTWKFPQLEENSNEIDTPVTLARKTAEAIGIPFVFLDVREQFYENVVQNFIQKYLAGQTPNPCLFCNPQVKWGVLQTYALEHGGDYFATGHYARIKKEDSGQVRLLKGADVTKDQSYVLAMLTQNQLRHTLLPLGDLTKLEVRKHAIKYDLPPAEQKDSQDLCFLGGIDYRNFLRQYVPQNMKPGEIVNTEGKVVGEHMGLPFYTVGQRRGIQVSASEPYYVIGKDVLSNRLIVGFSDEAQRDSLTAKSTNWISGHPPDAGQFYDVMTRYRAKPMQASLLSISDGNFRLKFRQPLRGITPGQVAVLYEGDECLGSGIIQQSG